MKPKAKRASKTNIVVEPIEQPVENVEPIEDAIKPKPKRASKKIILSLNQLKNQWKRN